MTSDKTSAEILMLMTRDYPDMGSASDGLMPEANFQPITSTTQIWVVTRHQYGISALVCQTSGGIAKCGLFLSLILSEFFWDDLDPAQQLWSWFIKGTDEFLSGRDTIQLFLWCTMIRADFMILMVHPKTARSLFRKRH